VREDSVVVVVVIFVVNCCLLELNFINTDFQEDFCLVEEFVYKTLTVFDSLGYNLIETLFR